MIRRARRGFSMIELLVVIGVILLLMTISVIGFIHIDKAGSEKSTHTRLALCQSMQAEYEASAQLTYIEGIGPGATPIPSFYKSALLNGMTYGLSTQATNPGDVSAGAANRYAVPTGSPGTAMVYTTGQIVQLFSQIPKVKSDLANVGTAALMQGAGGGSWLDINNKPLYVLFDAWKNPIIYVSSTGLPGVTMGGEYGQVLHHCVAGRPAILGIRGAGWGLQHWR